MSTTPFDASPTIVDTPTVPPRRGFFAHHGAWAPGVRLFRRLNFRAKAALISALFLVPILVLGALYARQVSVITTLTARERIGLEYTQQILHLMPLLQQQRERTLLARAEQREAGGADAAAAITAQLGRLDALQTTHGDPMQLSEELKLLRANIEKASQTTTGNPLAIFKRQTQAIDAALMLLDAVIDRSGLAVDPDLGLHYLLIAGLGQLPRVTEASLALGDLGLAVAGGAQGPMVQALAAPHRAIGQYLEAQVRQGLDQARALHPEVADRLAYAQTQEALAALQTVEIGGSEGTPAADPAALLAAKRTLAARVQPLQKEIDVQVDRLLSARSLKVERELMMVGAVLMTTVLLVAYMFISFSRVMLGGLSEVRRHLRAMTDGDLTTVPRPWGKDEAAYLMLALREMQDSMRDIVTQVRQASIDIVDGTGTISEDASQLARHSEASGVALQRTTESMQRIGATVRQTAERADEATTIGRENVDAAERGGRVIEDVGTTMRDIHDASSRIGEIIGVIDGIAFQTNILALNAAVEAARAGEAGRGFAVVASEVRSLAQRSASAAREVKTLVQSSVDKVETGVRVVQEAGTVIKDIVSASQKVNALIEDIAGSAREQAEGVQDTGRDVLEVDALIKNNGAMVQDAANAAGVLREQAQVLAQNVARFRLAGN